MDSSGHCTCQGEDCSCRLDSRDTIEFDNNGYIIQTAEELDYGCVIWHEYNDYEYNYGLNDYYEFISIEQEVKILGMEHLRFQEMIMYVRVTGKRRKFL